MKWNYYKLGMLAGALSVFIYGCHSVHAQTNMGTNRIADTARLMPPPAKGLVFKTVNGQREITCLQSGTLQATFNGTEWIDIRPVTKGQKHTFGGESLPVDCRVYVPLRMTGIHMELLPKYQRRELNPAVWWMIFGVIWTVSTIVITVYSTIWFLCREELLCEEYRHEE